MAGASERSPEDGAREAALRGLLALRPGAPQAAEELLRAGVVFWADLELDEAIALALPEANPEQRRLLLETDRRDRTDQLQLLLSLLLRLTLRDPLTGLYNRRHFEQRIEQELRRALREQTCCSMLLLDVDDFKQINDQRGHDVGDHTLCQLATALTETLRVSDEIARLGGDEFAALLPSTTPWQVVEYVDQRLRAAVAELAPGVTVSVGVASFRSDAPISGQELYRRTDEALYTAKRSGKNSISAFEDDSRATTAVTADEREALLR